MPKFSIYTVDAFADAPHQGNQAAVVPLQHAGALSDAQMQQIAGEMNLSETAFVVPKDPAAPDAFRDGALFGLRWFTPTVEVKLCGHATLATAYVLFNQLGNTCAALHFDTLSGELVVSRGSDGYLRMVFPADAPVPAPLNEDLRTVVAGVVGSVAEDAEVELSPSLRYLVVHSPGMGEAALETLVPRLTGEVYEAGRRAGIVAVLVTVRGSDRDFKSRVFAPWAGIDEDPVTGSAHTVLAPFWGQRLDKRAFDARQCSRRGGNLKVEMLDGGKVAVCGRGVVVIEGTLSV